jgi:hypothetical protein
MHLYNPHACACQQTCKCDIICTVVTIKPELYCTELGTRRHIIFNVCDWNLMKSHYGSGNNGLNLSQTFGHIHTASDKFAIISRHLMTSKEMCPSYCILNQQPLAPSSCIDETVIIRRPNGMHQLLWRTKLFGTLMNLDRTIDFIKATFLLI